MRRLAPIAASIVTLVFTASCSKPARSTAEATQSPASAAALPIDSHDPTNADHPQLPEPTEHAFAQVGDLRMYYEIFGEGPPLVLLHGGGSTIQESWAHQIPYFAKTRRVIAPEQMGHGHTRDLNRPLSYVDMAEDTAQLLTQLGIRDADVVGWSDGGIIGLHLAAHHPALVRRLVISGANITPSGLTPETLADSRKPPVDDPAGRARYARLFADPVEHFPVFTEKLNDLWLNHPTETELSVADLGKIQAPTLVVSADHDLIQLEHTLLIYRSIPTAELLILPGSHHNTFGDRPQWLNPIISDFLNQEIAPAH
jgi:pimeloyl-ACP methyl ester carboxylesterase